MFAPVLLREGVQKGPGNQTYLEDHISRLESAANCYSRLILTSLAALPSCPSLRPLPFRSFACFCIVCLGSSSFLRRAKARQLIDTQENRMTASTLVAPSHDYVLYTSAGWSLGTRSMASENNNTSNERACSGGGFCMTRRLFRDDGWDLESTSALGAVGKHALQPVLPPSSCL